MSETIKKKSGKKTVIATAVLVVLIAVFTVAYFLLAPQAAAGTKDITIRVIDDVGTETAYDVNTDAAYLLEVFDEVDALTIEGGDGDYGFYITAVNGLTADVNTNGAYWSIYVNGEVGMNGASTQPVVDGDEYSLVYEVYNAEAAE